MVQPVEWITTTVGNIASRERNALVGGPFGSNLVSKDYEAVGVPVIRGQNMSNGRWVNGDFVYVSDGKAKELSANTGRPWDIVFTQRGTLGQVAIVPEDSFDRYIVSQSQMKLTVDRRKADPLFVYYLFSSPAMQEYMITNAIQTGVPHTNLGILRNTPIRIPARVEDQRAIAHILGTLDDKIELNRQMNRTLDEIARTLFTSWFVNFDPVRAKAEGRQPEGMDAQTAALFPDRFVDSELGLIPEGWATGSFTSLAEVIGGGTPKTSVGEYWNGCIPWFAMADLPKNGSPFVVSTEKQITEAGEVRSSAKRISKYSTILTARGTVSEMVLAGVDMAFNQSCYALQPTSEQIGPFTLFLLARSQVDVLRSRAHGSVFSTITRATLDSLIVPIPDPAILSTMEALVAPIFELMLANSRESATLAALRDTLLPRLMRDGLSVNNGQSFVR